MLAERFLCAGHDSGRWVCGSERTEDGPQKTAVTCWGIRRRGRAGASVEGTSERAGVHVSGRPSWAEAAA